MEFRTHLKRLEEIGATEGFTKAYWFIEKAVLSGDLRKQIVAAAGGECEYRKLRKALMAIVPRVNKEEDASGRPSPGNRHWKTRNHPHPRQVHATTDDTADDSEKDEMEDPAHDALRRIRSLVDPGREEEGADREGPRVHEKRVPGGPRVTDQ